MMTPSTTQPTGAALGAQNLRIAYGETIVVPGLSVALRRGQVTALVGPNGSGKSTVLRALARLLRPSAGVVYLDGREIARLSTREVARRLAVLPQSPDVPQGATVWDLIAFGRYPHQGLLAPLSDADRAAMRWALELTGLSAMSDRMVDTLSGGERQRAWIALALAQQTEVLLLDEPTTFLDIRYQLDVLSLVRRLNRQHGITVGWALHDLNHAAAYSDHVAMLRAGAIVAEGPPEQVLRPQTIRDVFQVDVVMLRHPQTGAPICLPYQHEDEDPARNQ
jgi:ABC-type cobalamin/Fe3+-siderophores transport system ATPase subunit